MKMKKLLLAFVFIASTAIANAQAFKNGDQIVGATIGLGSVLYSGSGYTSSVPPLSFTYEKGVKDGIFDKGVLSIGGYFGYTSASWEYNYGYGSYGWKYSSLILGVRGILHYQLISNNKLDTYAGVMLGYNVVTATATGTASTLYGNTTSASASGIIFPFFVGARYYFTDQISANAELGYGIAYLNLGLGYKF